jgi:lipoprotein-anchoring transpeptidase ErfK/SrfK
LANFSGPAPRACDRNGLGILRAALFSGVALSWLAGWGSPADAAPRRPGYAIGYPYSYPYPYAVRPAPVVRSAPALRQPQADAVKKPEKEGFPDVPKGGVLQMVISIASQRLTLFSDGVAVKQSPVSTGTASHPTPLGVFSVIEKDRYHRSNLYGNAPMFFMQRVTWSGVAMHEGVLPGVPASHGCIRLPSDFAARLWPTTKLGVRVIIARNELAPVEFSHPALFAPKAKPPEPRMVMNSPSEGTSAAQPIRMAEATVAAGGVRDVATPAPSAQMDEAGRAAEDATAPVETTIPAEAIREGSTQAADAAPTEETVKATGMVTPAAPAAGSIPIAPSDLRKSVEVPQLVKPTDAKPAAAPAADAAPGGSDPNPAPAVDPPKPAVPPRYRAADQPRKRAGQVAVFVSRKEKKLFVRQGFIPLFEMPIVIENMDQPLGTHAFTAMGYTNSGSGMRWNLVTVPNDLSRAPAPRDTRQDPRRKPKEPPKPVVDLKPPSSAAEALNRIQMPKEAADRIGEILIPGSSLVISDEGLGRETGRYTEFIVITR